MTNVQVKAKVKMQKAKVKVYFCTLHFAFCLLTSSAFLVYGLRIGAKESS
jgi:hypothetical protein